MNRVHFRSKKFTAFVVAVILTTVFTIAGLVTIAIIPSAAASIVNLITVSLATMNGAVSMYTIGQSVVDYRIQANHNTSVSDVNSSSKEHKIEEYKKYNLQFEGDTNPENPFE